MCIWVRCSGPNSTPLSLSNQHGIPTPSRYGRHAYTRGPCENLAAAAAWQPDPMATDGMGCFVGWEREREREGEEEEGG